MTLGESKGSTQTCERLHPFLVSLDLCLGLLLAAFGILPDGTFFVHCVCTAVSLVRTCASHDTLLYDGLIFD